MRERSKTLSRRARGVAASGGGNVRRAPGVLYNTRTTACFARLIVHSHATVTKGIFVVRPAGLTGGGAGTPFRHFLLKASRISGPLPCLESVVFLRLRIADGVVVCSACGGRHRSEKCWVIKPQAPLPLLFVLRPH